jgi:predicted nucleic acid-binding Zn ribbon protein
VPAEPSDDLSRERRPPANRDDRPDPPSTAERFFPQGGGQRRGRPAENDWSELADSWPQVRGVEAQGGDKPSAGRSSEPADGVVGPEAGATQGEGGSGAQEGADGPAGPELARAVLDAALAKRRAAASVPRRRGASGEGTNKRLRGYSGPGPDPRDPQLFGDMLQRLMKARGWERPRAEATVFGAWEKVVGPDIAKHSRPIKLDAGVLTVEAESTAWATQLRLLAGKLLKSIAAEVGHNVVTRLNIHGPAAPSWTKGPRRVQGRGPRDTYG